jgi:hypothetical protein
MVNGMLDFGDDEGISGFVGGGVGMARVKFNNQRVFENRGAFLDDIDTRLLAGDCRRSSGDHGHDRRAVEVSLLQRRQHRKCDARCGSGRRSESRSARTACSAASSSTSVLLRRRRSSAAAAAAAPPPPPPLRRLRRLRRRASRVRSSCSSTGIVRIITPQAARSGQRCRCLPATGQAQVGLPATLIARVRPSTRGLSQRRADSVRSYLSVAAFPTARLRLNRSARPSAGQTADVSVSRRTAREVTFGPGSGM